MLHGSFIIENALLPIGLLSEEAQEARNKDIKKYGEHHTRKISRVKTMEDLFNNLLVSSDLYISSLRKTYEKKSIPLTIEAKQLLLLEKKEYANEDEYEEQCENETC